MSKYKTAASLLVTALVLQGCSMTLPARGTVQTTGETFEGTATGYVDRSGILNVVTSTGVTCEGVFSYTSGSRGSGVLECEDGRVGDFEFVSSGTKGSGTGTIGDDKFIFRFGR